MEDGCIVTSGFGHELTDIVGKFEVNKNNPQAVALWELFRKNPTVFSFEVGYTVKEDGTAELLEVSIVQRPRNEQVTSR